METGRNYPLTLQLEEEEAHSAVVLYCWLLDTLTCGLVLFFIAFVFTYIAPEDGCIFLYPDTSDYENAMAKRVERWKTSRADACQLRNITMRLNMTPGNHAYELGNNRKQTPWIARLRTGHYSLNKCLASFNIIDGPMWLWRCKGNGHF